MPLHPIQQLENPLGHQLVQRRSHLVADDHLRLGGQGPGDADPLLLPAGQLRRQSLHELARVEFDHLQQLGHPLTQGLALESQVERQRSADDVDDTLTWIEGRVGDLVDHLDAAQLRLAAAAIVRRQDFTVEQHLPAARLQQAGNQSRRGALAAARLADHRQGLAPIETHRDIVQHRLLAVAGRSVTHFEQRPALLRPALGVGTETAHRPQRLGVVLGRRLEHLPGRRLLHPLAMAQHHDPVGHLRDHRQVMGDVDRRHAEALHRIANRRQHFDLGGDVEGRGRLVEDDQVRLAGHGHGGHRPLQLATGNLVRITLADAFRIRQAQHPVELHCLGFGLGAFHPAIDHGGLHMLVDQPLRRVERGRRALRHIGDAQATQFAQGLGGTLAQVQAVEMNRAAGDPATVAGIPHGGEAQGRLARAGFTDQAQHLAPGQGQVDALHQRMPGIVVVPFDMQVADLQQARVRCVHAQHSFSPLER